MYFSARVFLVHSWGVHVPRTSFVTVEAFTVKVLNGFPHFLITKSLRTWSTFKERQYQLRVFMFTVNVDDKLPMNDVSEAQSVGFVSDASHFHFSIVLIIQRDVNAVRQVRDVEVLNSKKLRASLN